ncbi:DUF3618 domain-containing protein [Chelativorans salis]|uniref:DUF3618 domain-containing protein n=1 Tax=Chelativorans salis TaxID=2978478 RepID=A0ABT2LIF2_9HYPH|nr:DUF3618 domain-containing protein [Chelativorans sp. EGI FJ00035]MCT7374094.1 DUF3618 domain-containing protein [Chelativorans sp. EGI FJ00035]
MNTDARTPADIERDLEQERDQLVSAVEALQERFSIEGVARQLAEQVTRHGGEFGNSALRSAKSNPMALALTGLGLAWMMFSDTRRDQGEKHASSAKNDAMATSPGVGTTPKRWDRLHSDASWFGQRTRESAEDLRNRLYEGTEQLSDTAKKRVVEAREAAYRAQRDLEQTAGRGSKAIKDFYLEQPIVSGALAVALGAVIGAALPRTSAEDSTIGESSDRLFEEAERIFSEELNRAAKAANSASRRSGAAGKRTTANRSSVRSSKEQ